jgi:hypothetical protein
LIEINVPSGSIRVCDFDRTGAEGRDSATLWQLDLAQRHIREGNTRVEEQRALIVRMQMDGEDVTLANELLENLIITLDSFHDFSRRVAGNLKNGTI